MVKPAYAIWVFPSSRQNIKACIRILEGGMAIITERPATTYRLGRLEMT